MITSVCRLVMVCVVSFSCVVGTVEENDQTIVWQLKTPVYLGGNASIACVIQYIDKPGHMAWTKAGTPIGLNNMSLVMTKYDVFVKNDRNFMMYHLVIKNIDIGDLNLVYRCESGFLSAEGILSLNEDTFVAKPQKEDITKTFTLKGGYLRAFVEVASVYPKPICIAEFKDRDITTYSKTNYTKKTFFYSMEFDLVYQTNECGNINISCVIGKKKLSILQLSHEFKEGCKHSNTNNSLSEGEVTIIIVAVLIAVALFAVGVLIFRYLRRSGNGNIENTVSDENIPLLELRSTDERTAYIEALQAGKEVRRYVRIHVIGKDGVGKTSLVRRLLGKPIDDVTSTDGIEIDRTCQIRTSDGEWIISGVETEQEKIRRRIMHAINSYPEGKARVRHLSEDYVSDTEENEGNHKRDPSQDLLFPKKTNEYKIFPIDKPKPIAPNQQILIAETLGANATATENDKEPSTKYKYECSSGLNDSFDDNKSIIRETGDSEVIVPIQTTRNQNHLNLDKADEMTKAITENMDNILLNTKKNKEKNTSDTSNDLVDCGIWDFAGHKAYRATHQTFLTPDAIYLLVADITDDIKPMEYDEKFDNSSCGEYIDFWIDSIQYFHEAFQCSSANEPTPSIVIVCTGIDKILERDKEDRKKEYVQTWIDTFRCQNKGSKIRDRIHFISNTESSPKVFEYLRKQISEIAKERKYFAENLPTQWIQLENALTILKDLKEKEKIGYCEKRENVETLAHEISLEKDDLLRFLNYQHKIGNLIYFDDKRDYIILEPNWLVDCFRCLVCDDEKKRCTETALYDLKNKGILSDNLINKLFSKVPELMIEKNKKIILRVMEQFDIIVKPKSFNSYYIPYMIENSSPLEDIKKEFNVANSECSPWLVLEFKFLPIAHFNHIFFTYISSYEACTVEKQYGEVHPAIYAGKAVIYLDQTKFRLCICFSRNAICLQLWNWDIVEDNTYQQIIQDICNIIEELKRKPNHRLDYDYEIKAKCSTGDYSSTLGRITYEDLIKLSDDETYFCQQHNCDHDRNDLGNTWLKHTSAHYRHQIEEADLKHDVIHVIDDIPRFETEEIEAIQDKALKGKVVEFDQTKKFMKMKTMPEKNHTKEY